MDKGFVFQRTVIFLSVFIAALAQKFVQECHAGCKDGDWRVVEGARCNSDASFVEVWFTLRTRMQNSAVPSGRN